MTQYLPIYTSIHHSAMLDLGSETTFFDVFDGHGGNHNICLLCSLNQTAYEEYHYAKYLQNLSLTFHNLIPLLYLGRVAVKFCTKYPHNQVLKNEAYSIGDLGPTVLIKLKYLLYVYNKHKVDCVNALLIVAF